MNCLLIYTYLAKKESVWIDERKKPGDKRRTEEGSNPKNSIESHPLLSLQLLGQIRRHFRPLARVRRLLVLLARGMVELVQDEFAHFTQWN